ncbi:MAG TPA: IPT/TIG domain-containing protein, partial [Candidatus Eremiobacteraceae bacterium]|nr:IPT/TIG domain-containing protein [Candidatus Eremiobacteraceae bacterium]
MGTSVTITGTNFTGATSVGFNGTTATFSVTDASHIATSAPNGATTGTISVTTPGGTATSSNSFAVTASAGLDLTIDGLYITQATQNYPAHDVGLISGRSAWVRVFVLAN